MPAFATAEVADADAAPIVVVDPETDTVLPAFAVLLVPEKFPPQVFAFNGAAWLIESAVAELTVVVVEITDTPGKYMARSI